MKTRRTGRPAGRLRLEALESREVPALLVAINQAQLLIWPQGPPPRGPDDYMPHVVRLQRSGADLKVIADGRAYEFAGASVQSINVRTGSGNDVVHVESLPRAMPVEVYTGAGDDTVEIADGLGGNDLRSVNSVVAIDGGAGIDAVRIHDEGYGRGERYAFNTRSVFAAGAPGLGVYHTAEQVAIGSGGGADTFSDWEDDYCPTPLGWPPPPPPGWLDIVAAGLVPDPWITIDAGSGIDRLVGADRVNAWQVDGVNVGSLNRRIRFGDVESLAGGAAADTFALVGPGRLGGAIDGGGGFDTLDYSAYAGTKAVDLRAGTAAGLAGAVNVEAAVGL